MSRDVARTLACSTSWACLVGLGLFFALAAPAQDRTAAALARSIHEAGLDPAECYRVRDLSLVREDLKLYFTDGYLIFGKPVAGERLSVAFSGDVEGGDGEVLLLPPNPAERRSLARFTQSPNLDEHFRAALMIFTDATAAELLAQIRDEGRGRKATTSRQPCLPFPRVAMALAQAMLRPGEPPVA